ncbi:hypothetical protein NST11_04865 [Caldifermentibacillus hisashii]|jgi:hypothetical protein|uniref:hypothetical protein n=1 Tax=Caldifermentibacillus hisashii TaxID=996558 RepID=UPI002E2230A7|nr:hypothetical protein [Caldifermentibacillus hisashii]
MRLIKSVHALLCVILLTVCNADETKTKHQSAGGEINLNKVEPTGNVTIREVLEENKDADIFYLNRMVFINAENIDWVKNIDQTIGEEVAQIKKQTVDPEQFDGGTASKLAVGTKIYKLANHPGPVYLAVVDGETIPYLGLME